MKSDHSEACYWQFPLHARTATWSRSGKSRPFFSTGVYKIIVQEGKLTSSYIETQKEHFILMIQGIDNGVFKECGVFFGRMQWSICLWNGVNMPKILFFCRQKNSGKDPWSPKGLGNIVPIWAQRPEYLFIKCLKHQLSKTSTWWTHFINTH